MYCSVHEAWNDKNSLTNLSKRYYENFQPEFNSNVYKINQNDNQKKDLQSESNLSKDYNQIEDIQTEDIFLRSDSEDNKTKNIKKTINKVDNCKELIDKVLNCPVCRKMLEKKFNKNPLNNLINSEIREIMILILIGLIIMIIIDLFIRISTPTN